MGLINKCTAFYNKEEEIKYAVICLPGRGQDGESFAESYSHCCELENTVFIGPTPKGYAWYPMPISPENQNAALSGIPKARHAVESVVNAVRTKFKLPKNKIALVGFSAGGVMAINTALHSKDDDYALVVSHAGAILDTSNVPYANRCSTPYFLFHCQDDNCFDWYERYIPMRKALRNAGYITMIHERKYGGHTVFAPDVKQVALYLARNRFPQSIEWESGESWRKEKIHLEVA